MRSTQSIVVPRTLNRRAPDGRKQQLEAKVVWQKEDYRQIHLINTAATILKGELTPGAVVFDLNAKDFQKHTQAYALIEEQVGPFKQRGACPIFKYGRNSETNMTLEVSFLHEEDAKKAVEKGVIVNNLLYKGARVGSQDQETRTTCDVTLSQLPYDRSINDFVTGVRNSLRHFGKVIRIVQLTDEGYFEGQAKVTFDTTPFNGRPWEPLQRIIYMEDFRKNVTASWKDAPVICFKCGVAGHRRDDCPEMAKITCYACHNKGHYQGTVKCPLTNPKSDSQEIAEYEAVRESAQKKVTPAAPAKSISSFAVPKPKKGTKQTPSTSAKATPSPPTKTAIQDSSMVTPIQTTSIPIPKVTLTVKEPTMEITTTAPDSEGEDPTYVPLDVCDEDMSMSAKSDSDMEVDGEDLVQELEDLLQDQNRDKDDGRIVNTRAEGLALSSSKVKEKKKAQRRNVFDRLSKPVPRKEPSGEGVDPPYTQVDRQ